MLLLIRYVLQIVKAIFEGGKRRYPHLWDKAEKYVHGHEFSMVEKMAALPSQLPLTTLNNVQLQENTMTKRAKKNNVQVEKNPGSYSEWERLIVEQIAEQLEATNADAQGIVMGQAFAMAQAWGLGLGVVDASNKVLVAATVVEPAKVTTENPLDILRSYPAQALVSEFYDVTDDGDKAFGNALIHIFGDSFEYPDFSHRTVGAVVKMALALEVGSPAKQQPRPDMCFQFNPAGEPGKYVVAVKRGESGCFKTTYDERDPEKAQALVHLMNRKLGVSAEEVGCMEVGSMFGWNVPGAQLDSGLKPKSVGRHLCVDGHEFADTESNWSGDGQFPPFAVFYIDAQKNLLPYYLTRKQAEIAESGLEAEAIAQDKGPYVFIDANRDRSLLGKVLAVTGSHVVLSLGRSAAIVAQSDLNRVPAMGENVSVVFKGGMGSVSGLVLDSTVDRGR